MNHKATLAEIIAAHVRLRAEATNRAAHAHAEREQRLARIERLPMPKVSIPPPPTVDGTPPPG